MTKYIIIDPLKTLIHNTIHAIQFMLPRMEVTPLLNRQPANENPFNEQISALCKQTQDWGIVSLGFKCSELHIINS